MRKCIPHEYYLDNFWLELLLSHSESLNGQSDKRSQKLNSNQGRVYPANERLQNYEKDHLACFGAHEKYWNHMLLRGKVLYRMPPSEYHVEKKEKLQKDGEKAHEANHFVGCEPDHSKSHCWRVLI